MDQNRLHVLNTEFNSFLIWFKSTLQQIDNEQDRNLAIAWMTKLKNVGGRTIEDYKLRNRIFIQLVHQCQQKKLLKPFDTPPAPGLKLMDIKEFFPEPIEGSSGKQVSGDIQLPMIMEKSPDKGAFLVTQPVPKCGAFCYLAVVSRPSKQ